MGKPKSYVGVWGEFFVKIIVAQDSGFVPWELVALTKLISKCRHLGKVLPTRESYKIERNAPKKVGTTGWVTKADIVGIVSTLKASHTIPSTVLLTTHN